MNFFPDGTIISDWFKKEEVSLNKLGKRYFLKNYVDNLEDINTEKIQSLIDEIFVNSGGVLIVDNVYKTGALFFKQGVNLYIEKDCGLFGSDDISDYPVIETRIEGETCLYYPALINVDSVDGFVICGKGFIDGNGLKSWKAFWQRRKWNPSCKNKDEQRPRLVYISNSKNVIISGITLQNSHFWTNHIYKCERVKFLDCIIKSPAEPIKAPSTDAIDIDACNDVFISGCNISVNDDAVVLKGGKGPYADKDDNNGPNERIIIEDCYFGFCHGCLTCGSESIHNRNIILRRCEVEGAKNLVWLKMRPDTPQLYEYIKIEDIIGNARIGLFIRPWVQFFDLKDRKDIPLSYANHICFKNIKLTCNKFFEVVKDLEQYKLSDFSFYNMDIKANKYGYKEDVIENVVFNSCDVEEIGYEFKRDL